VAEAPESVPVRAAERLYLLSLGLTQAPKLDNLSFNLSAAAPVRYLHIRCVCRAADAPRQWLTCTPWTSYTVTSRYERTRVYGINIVRTVQISLYTVP
jgi:hypothetical protein